MAVHCEVCSFSGDGASLAVAGLDGEVKIWESSSGTLKQRFSPSSVGSRIQALAWSRPAKEKRKRKSSTPTHSFLAVAVGNNVIIWNVTKGEKEATLSAHSDTVSSVSWGKKVLYSGSHDCHVIEWNLVDESSQHQWKADRHAVTCVCCHGKEELLLSAGRSIKMWNLSDHTLLQKFTGHSNNVSWLSFASDDTFMSTAVDDRTINLWRFSTKTRTAVGTLSCDEDVKSCDLRISKSDDTVEVAAVSTEGVCHLFKLSLVELDTEPVTAFSSVQFATEATKDSTPTPLPVLTAHLSTTFTLAHTSHIRPHFESLDFNQSERMVCLIREISSSGLLLTRQSTKKSKVADNKVTILGPGNMTFKTGHAQKSGIEDNIPLSDRLEPVSKPKSSGQPSSESLTQLLTQAVASGDDKLLEEVLRVHKEKIVRATVRRLPVTVVLPFLRKLIEMLQTQPGRGLELSLWIRTILTCHTAYLMTVPQLVDSLSGLYQLLDARVGTFSRLSRLQGKLDLMLTQAATAKDTEQDHAHLTTPLLTVTVGEDSIRQTQDDDVQSSDDEWSSGSESSLSEEGNQSDHSSIAMETEHPASMEYV